MKSYVPGRSLPNSSFRQADYNYRGNQNDYAPCAVSISTLRRSLPLMCHKPCYISCDNTNRDVYRKPDYCPCLS